MAFKRTVQSTLVAFMELCLSIVLNNMVLEQVVITIEKSTLRFVTLQDDRRVFFRPAMMSQLLSPTKAAIFSGS